MVFCEIRISCGRCCKLVIWFVEIVCKDMLCILKIRVGVLGIAWLKLDKCWVLVVPSDANM